MHREYATISRYIIQSKVVSHLLIVTLVIYCLKQDITLCRNMQVQSILGIGQ